MITSILFAQLFIHIKDKVYFSTSLLQLVDRFSENNRVTKDKVPGVSLIFLEAYSEVSRVVMSTLGFNRRLSFTMFNTPEYALSSRRETSGTSTVVSQLSSENLAPGL